MLTEELAIGLFELAEKYMIDELKLTCENYLQHILTGFLKQLVSMKQIL